MTYEESVRKNEWRNVAIHRVVLIARIPRDFNEIVDREFDLCIDQIFQATCVKEAQEAMARLRFK